MFESGNVKAVPAVTASSDHAPRTIHSANRCNGSETPNYNVVSNAASSAPGVTSVLSSLISSETSNGRLSGLKGDNDSIAIRIIENMAASLHSLVSAHALYPTTNDGARATTTTKNNNKIANASLPAHASDIDTAIHPNISTAVLAFPRSSLLFLNTTSPNYVLVDYTNATVVVWRASPPVNAPIAGTSARPRDTILDELSTALPYVEACGLVAVVWEVGRFVYARIRACRVRRVCLSTSTRSSQDA